MCQVVDRVQSVLATLLVMSPHSLERGRVGTGGGVGGGREQVWGGRRVHFPIILTALNRC